MLHTTYSTALIPPNVNDFSFLKDENATKATLTPTNMKVTCILKDPDQQKERIFMIQHPVNLAKGFHRLPDNWKADIRLPKTF